MDPDTLTRDLVREIARDGVYGTPIEDTFEYVSRISKYKIDDGLKDALMDWLKCNPDLEIHDDGRVYASVDLQRKVLTNSDSGESVIGDLAFKLLSLISHSRKAGVTTAEAAKQTGQDPRSLFGRVQSLVDLKLISRFPVIEKGYSTHKLLFHEELDNHAGWARKEAENDDNLDSKSENGFVDIERLGKIVVDFCKEGPNGLRLTKDIIFLLNSELTEVSKSRKRPIVMRIIQDLANKQLVRRVYMYDPEFPDRQYSCVEYLRDFTHVDVINASVAQEDDEDEANDLYTEENDQVTELDTQVSQLDLSKAVDSLGNNCHANLVHPFVNQIFNEVYEHKAKGISAMDLIKRLAGRSYRKTFSKYLDLLAESKKPQQKRPELGYLDLVRGLDFHHKVKYYRYFAKPFFPKSYTDNDVAKWGHFPSAPVSTKKLSLRELDHKVTVPIPGSCSVVQLEDGSLVPCFRGDNVKGKVISLSKCDSTRKLGRPKKANTKAKVSKSKKTKTNPKSIDPNLIALDPEASTVPQKDPNDPESFIIPHAERHWNGGKQTVSSKRSIWLSLDDTDAVDNLKSEEPITSEVLDLKPDVLEHRSATHLAAQKRIDLIMKTIKHNHGAVVNGATLISLYGEQDDAASTIDRRTLNKVAKELISVGKIHRIEVHVSTGTGTDLVKEILYDPSIIPDPDDSDRINELKYELTEGQKQKHSTIQKAALEAVKSGSTAVPRLALSEEQIRVLKPRPARMLTTKSRNKERKETTKTRFGPSASEVLGLDEEGRTLSKQKRRKSPEDLAAPATETRKEPVDIDSDYLIRAIIVFRSLYAVKTNIDWSAIVSGLGNKVSPSAAKKRWPSIKNKLLARDPSYLRTRTKDFENLFFAWFEQGKIELIDKSKIDDAIPYYTNWWKQQDVALKSIDSNSSTLANSDISTLTSHLKRINLKYVFPKSLIDQFASLQLQPSVVNAEKILASSSFGSVSFYDEFEGLKFTDLEMKMRAIVAADDGPSYSPSAAVNELGPVSDDEAKEAIKSLERQRYIQWAESDPSKVPVGRPYILSDKIKQALVPPKLGPDCAAHACSYLSSQHAGDEFDFNKAATESEMIVLLGLSTFGLDNLTATLPRYNEKFGFLTDNYKSRGIDKQEFECDVGCAIHEMNDGSLVEDGSNSISKLIEPPKSETENRPWIWQTKYLGSNQIWLEVALKIVLTVLFRPGIPSELITYSLRSVLPKDETMAAIHALTDGGALYKEGSALRATNNWFQYLYSTK